MTRFVHGRVCQRMIEEECCNLILKNNKAVPSEPLYCEMSFVNLTTLGELGKTIIQFNIFAKVLLQHLCHRVNAILLDIISALATRNIKEEYRRFSVIIFKY